MAAGRIVLPSHMPALDLNGDPVPGARLTFYQNETTTLATVYTSGALDVPHPNPVVADTAGVFPSIFADTAVAFSVGVTDGDGAPIGGLRNLDNVYPSLFYGVDAAAAVAVEADRAELAAAAAEAAVETKAEKDLSNIAAVDLIRRSNKAAPTNNRIAFLGDSITAQGVDNGSISGTTAVRNMNRGMTYWVPFLTGQRFRSTQALNFGISGQTSGQIAARVGDVVASGAGVCVVLAGTNDVGSNNYATTTANLTAIYQALADANILIVALPILNRTLTTSADYGFINRINHWMAAQAQVFPNFRFVDPYLFGDPYSLTFGPKTGFTYDGLHPTAIGMRYIAKAVADYLNTLLPPLPRAVRDVNDFSSVSNPAGYRNVNPMLAGTAGSKGSGVTGDVADSWAVNLSAGGGDVSSLTAVCSKDTGATSLICQKIVIGGTATGGFQTVLVFEQYDYSAAYGFQAGDLMECIADIEIIGGAESISGVAAYAVTQQAGAWKYSWDGFPYVSDDLSAEGFAGVARTPPLAINAAPSVAGCGLWVFLKNNAAAARGLTLKINSIAARKVTL